MFEQFFGKVSAVVHHKAAPYAAQRERFLEHCAQQGHTSDYLKTLAATLLVALIIRIMLRRLAPERAPVEENPLAGNIIRTAT